MAELKEVFVPDLGGATDVDVIEINVASGDVVAKEDSLLTLEGDKASMEIPAPFAGTVKDIKLAVGAKVSEGDLMLVMEVTAKEQPQASSTVAPKVSPQAAVAPAKPSPKADTEQDEIIELPSGKTLHAGPAVRRIAREFGVDLTRIKGTGRKERIIKEDVQAYVKFHLARAQGDAGSALPKAPTVDFSKFGEVEIQALSKIKKATGVNLHRNWVLVPHVTQFDDADITDLEALRGQHKEAVKAKGLRLTVLGFLLQACAAALKVFPQFNASLDGTGENLILKKYIHIGVAVDTPNGLVVPVIRDVDQKTLLDLAAELGEFSEKAREGQLTMKDMQGGCFSISSLGGIGGTAFTPIVNMPEVAILGVSRAAHQPVYEAGEFIPRLKLPLSLSYDHRVIDGANAARFTQFLCQYLQTVGNFSL